MAFSWYIPSSAQFAFCSGAFRQLSKRELLLGLTQLIMLKVAFQEEYLTKHLSVVARWN